MLEDDETHPIPFVGSLDTALTSNVGLRLGIVIASPLKSDERSKQRLSQKFEGYVREFAMRREQWLTENQEPMKAWLYISVHPGSDTEMLKLIEHYRAWVESNSITVVMSKLHQQ